MLPDAVLEVGAVGERVDDETKIDVVDPAIDDDQIDRLRRIVERAALLQDSRIGSRHFAIDLRLGQRHADADGRA